MIAAWRSILRDDAGNAIPEYAIVATAIALAMLTTMSIVGHEAGTQLGNANQSLTQLAVKPQ